MQDNAQNKQLYILHSNNVDAKKQINYLGKLGENELNSKMDYDGETLETTRAFTIDKDLMRSTQNEMVMILRGQVPKYASADEDKATEAILEYKETLITHLEEKHVPQAKCDQLASMMINLNNQGLYAGLSSITSPLLQGDPFVPMGNTSYKVTLRQEGDNYFIDAKIFTNVAHIDKEKTILTTIDINYTFDLQKNTMQFKVEDTRNYSTINEDCKKVFKDICKGIIGASQSSNKTIKDSLFAAEFDLKKAKTENNRNSHMRAGLYMLGSLLLIALYVYNKINSGNNRTEEHPPQDYTNSTHTNWIDATRATESIVQYTQK